MYPYSMFRAKIRKIYFSLGKKYFYSCKKHGRVIVMRLTDMLKVSQADKNNHLQRPELIDLY